MKEKKVWHYYYKHPDYKMDARLYAVTAKRDFAELFEDTRDMRKFLRVVDWVEKGEIVPYLGKHSDSQLTYTSLKTKDSLDPTQSIYIPMLLTWGEEKAVVATEDSYAPEISKLVFDPYFFKDEMLRCLKRLGFLDSYQFITQFGYMNPPDDPLFRFFDTTVKDEEDKPVRRSYLPELDQFALFMQLYGSTMKK